MLIYKITNTVNGKVYIGQTTYPLYHRWSAHKQNTSHCKYLGAAIVKYGEDKFKIEQIDTAETFDELNEKEVYWIKFYDAQNREKGYNLRSGGDSSLHSEESKAKMSQTRKGKKQSKELIQKRIESRKGYTHSEKTRELIGKANTGKKRRPWTEEEKKQIGERSKGRKYSPETIEKMRIAAKNRKTKQIYTDETRKKLSEKTKAYWQRKKQQEVVDE